MQTTIQFIRCPINGRLDVGIDAQGNGPQDGVTHTLLEHAVSTGLHNVMIEVRNDQIATPEAQAGVADMLSRLISSGLRDLGIAGAGGDT